MSGNNTAATIVFNQLCEVVLDTLNVLGVPYNDELKWGTDLKDFYHFEEFDELALIEIQVNIEEYFNIPKLPDDMTRISAIVNFIVKKLGDDVYAL